MRRAPAPRHPMFTRIPPSFSASDCPLSFAPPPTLFSSHGCPPPLSLPPSPLHNRSCTALLPRLCCARLKLLACNCLHATRSSMERARESVGERLWQAATQVQVKRQMCVCSQHEMQSSHSEYKRRRGMGTGLAAACHPLISPTVLAWARASGHGTCLHSGHVHLPELIIDVLLQPNHFWKGSGGNVGRRWARPPLTAGASRQSCLQT